MLESLQIICRNVGGKNLDQVKDSFASEQEGYNSFKAGNNKYSGTPHLINLKPTIPAIIRKIKNARYRS